MESWHIVHALEKQYPTPSLRLDDPVVEKVRNLTMLAPIAKHVMPKVPHILSDVSAEYFYTTREEIYGKSLQQLAAEASDADWEKMRVAAKEIGDVLREKEGPFFLGETGELGSSGGGGKG